MIDTIAKNSCIYVAGHNGMVGSALVRRLYSLGCNNLVLASRRELDLCNQQQVDNFFVANKIDYVIIAAAKVGGIYANSAQPADFIYDNLVMSTNIVHASYENKVQRLLYLGSSCIYPRLSPQPMHESSLLSGKLEFTNEAYAIAKIAGIKLCEAFNRQYNTDYRAVMPTNLYGKNDNFHSQNSHVLPALMRRFHEAKLNKQTKVEVWGSGTPTREFLHVDDMADACIFVLNLPKKKYIDATGEDGIHLNVGTGKEVSIEKLAQLIAASIGYHGEIVFNASKPDGTPRKVTNTTKLNKIGWQARIELEKGITDTYRWFQEYYSKEQMRL